MAKKFIDIAIGELDPERSFKRSGAFWDKVFTLSSKVPKAWATIFTEVWEDTRYVPKRHARIEDHAIVTICLAEEVSGEHMGFLIQAVNRTNQAYRKSLAQKRPS